MNEMPGITGLISEGKGKKVYGTENPDLAVFFFKDEAMAFHGLKRGKIFGKGEVNNNVCRHVFTMLRENGIENHFVRQLDPRQCLVRRCEMLPFTVKIRNRAAGSLANRLSCPVGTVMDPPVLEFSLKFTEVEGEDTLINSYHIAAMKMATSAEVEEITAVSMHVNRLLTGFLHEIGIELIDFKLEFGRHNDRILLADEISPDTSRFWDSKTHEPLDIDRFRRDLGDVAEAYQEVLHRMMGMDIDNNQDHGLSHQ